ncbi:MAG: hypothetical protein H0Z33_09195 [Bacillaceae bacterium]|nr:hypothetical protein [Bacillaceae bacterium]
MAASITLVLFLFSLIFAVSGRDIDTFSVVVWGIISAILFGIYWGKSPHLMIIRGGQNRIVLFRKSPSEGEVDQFVENILEARKQYLRKKQAKIDPDLPAEDQLYHLKYLLDQEIITEDEYQSLIVKR